MTFSLFDNDHIGGIASYYHCMINIDYCTM